MFIHTFPSFEKGRILKKEMLESLRDYPRNFFDIYFENLSYGIISGADLVINDNSIKITRGILKHKDKIYILEKDYILPYQYTNKEVIIKIRFLEEEIEGDFNINPTKIFLDENRNIEENEMELGRFKLREGAFLRSHYKDFYDFSTEYNTVNLIHVPYAGKEKTTVSPLLLREFATILLKNKVTSPYDVSFAMACMNEGKVERDLILYYISNKLDIPFKEYSNEEIYKYLCQIIREIEGSSGAKKEIRQNRPMRILVD